MESEKAEIKLSRRGQKRRFSPTHSRPTTRCTNQHYLNISLSRFWPFRLPQAWSQLLADLVELPLLFFALI